MPDPADDLEAPPHRHDGREETSGAIVFLAKIVERSQDVISVVAGAILVVLAAVVLISGLVDFVRTIGSEPAVTVATHLLDRVLLVLILVEIVHTVVLSVRAHTLVAEPFIVVGLVAVIRKILLILGEAQAINAVQFGVLAAMVAVFVASFLLVRRLPPADDTHPH